MALIADSSNFEGGWYSDYKRLPTHNSRAAWINNVQPTGKLLIAGAGYGYTVAALGELGRDVWGVDASDYAMVRKVSSRILKANVLVRSQLTTAKNVAGLAGSTKFPAVVTDDLLPCLTNSEITTALAELRRIGTRLIHVVTCTKSNDRPGSRTADLNWKSQEQWKALVGTDLVFDTETELAI